MNMVSSNNLTIMFAAISYTSEIYQCTPLRKVITHTRLIQLTVNHTLALKKTLTCMVDLTCLQLDQTILNSSHTLGASVQ